MQDIGAAFALAFKLIVSGDSDLAEIVLLSLEVSLSAVTLAALIGMPLGAALALFRFPGPRRAGRRAQRADGPAAGGGRACSST